MNRQSPSAIITGLIKTLWQGIRLKLVEANLPSDGGRFSLTQLRWKHSNQSRSCQLLHRHLFHHRYLGSLWSRREAFQQSEEWLLPSHKHLCSLFTHIRLTETCLQGLISLEESKKRKGFSRWRWCSIKEKLPQVALSLVKITPYSLCHNSSSSFFRTILTSLST